MSVANRHEGEEGDTDQADQTHHRRVERQEADDHLCHDQHDESGHENLARAEHVLTSGQANHGQSQEEHGAQHQSCQNSLRGVGVEDRAQIQAHQSSEGEEQRVRSAHLHRLNLGRQTNRDHHDGGEENQRSDNAAGQVEASGDAGHIGEVCHAEAHQQAQSHEAVGASDGSVGSLLGDLVCASHGSVHWVRVVCSLLISVLRVGVLLVTVIRVSVVGVGVALRSIGAILRLSVGI